MSYHYHYCHNIVSQWYSVQTCSICNQPCNDYSANCDSLMIDHRNFVPFGTSGVYMLVQTTVLSLNFSNNSRLSTSQVLSGLAASL